MTPLTRITIAGLLAAVALGLPLSLAPAASAAGPSEGPVSADDPISLREGRNIHLLLTHHLAFRREVEDLYDGDRLIGIRAVTVATGPALVAPLMEHVAQMEHRLAEGRRIYQRDPVFRGIFDHADEVEMRWEPIPPIPPPVPGWHYGGVLVEEMSDNPAVAELIVEHAAKVDLFLVLGHDALRPVAGRRGLSGSP